MEIDQLNLQNNKLREDLEESGAKVDHLNEKLEDKTE